MTHGVRAVLSVLGLAFTTYLAAGALLWTSRPELPWLQIATVALFLITTWVCIFWSVRTAPHADPVRSRLGDRAVLPVWAAVLAGAVALIVPNATWVAAGPDALLADYATWSLGGVGALMAIVMIRRRPWTAWIGVAFAAISATFWIGLVDALTLGVVGTVLWVGVAQLLTWLVDRAARDTAQLLRLQREASEWLAAGDGVRRERRTQIQRALAVAGPVLAHTVALGGHLDETERRLARIAEATLRDELRGAALLDDDVRAALSAARGRGATVSVLDEGGLDGISGEERTALRAELAGVLEGISSERVFVRTSTHDDVVATVVGRSASVDGEDTVDVWHEIRRPGAGEDDANASGQGARG